MKKKLISLIAASFLAMSLLTGCGAGAEEPTTEATTEATSEAASEETEATTTEATEEATEVSGVESTDRAGNTVIIPDTVDKIVSMAPSTTRLLIDMGLADKIVAVDTNTGFSYAASLSADIPQFDMMAPDNEALVALEPDIIFTSGMSNLGGDDVYQSARDAGICVYDIPSAASINDIALDIVAIGDAVHAEDAASDIIFDFNDQLEQIQAIGNSITEKKTVLFEISLPSADYPSIYTFGTGTYLDEMITTIGAENVTGDQESWISISEEEAIAMNPDVIITNVNYVDDAVETIKSSEGWENVTAIQNGDVYYIDADASNQPNNHIIDALIQMGKAVYPDEFADFEDPFASATDAE